MTTSSTPRADWKRVPGRRAHYVALFFEHIGVLACGDFREDLEPAGDAEHCQRCEKLKHNADELIEDMEAQERDWKAYQAEVAEKRAAYAARLAAGF